jgi:hypothetical protein
MVSLLAFAGGQVPAFVPRQLGTGSEPSRKIGADQEPNSGAASLRAEAALASYAVRRRGPHSTARQARTHQRPSWESGRAIRRGASIPRSNGPRPEVRPPRPDVRPKALDSGQPFPGSVAGISDRSLFLLAPRTYEHAQQVPLSLPSDTSRRFLRYLATAANAFDHAVKRRVLAIDWIVRIIRRVLL